MKRFGKKRQPGCECTYHYTCGMCLLEAARQALALRFGVAAAEEAEQPSTS